MSNSRLGLRTRPGLIRSYTEGIGATSLFLDLYPSASAAYSLRKLRDAYTGSAIRVRRSNDNTEQDIGFNSNNNFDESALSQFAGVNSCFVTTWYDQSGNARNATQTTAANQPRIVNSGTIDKEGSNPILVFDGSNDHFTSDGTYSLATHSIFATCKASNSNATPKTILSRSSTSVNTRREAFSYVYSSLYDLQVSEGTSFPTASKSHTITNFALLSGTISGATGTMSNYVNNVIGTTATSIAAGLTGTLFCLIGAVYENGVITYYMAGQMNEIIVYNTNQANNLSAMNSNINTYYGIY